MHVSPLYLTKEDVKSLEKRHLEIGRGTDGIVYKTGNKKTSNILYKIYYHSPILLEDPKYQKIFDNDGVNIADNRQFLNNKDVSSFHTSYYNQDGVRDFGIEAIYKAIERQQYIKRTQLQKQPIFINGRFGGTVLHYHKRHIAIHNLNMYPTTIQIRVLKELLLAVEELLKNYIYHIDLSLKPERNYKEANVLISLGLNPHPAIIDIDGKSAIYTETENKYYYYKSLLSFKALIMGILFEIDIDNLEELDYDYLENKLKQLGINPYFIEPIIDPSVNLDITELNEFLDDILLVKKRH